MLFTLFTFRTSLFDPFCILSKFGIHLLILLPSKFHPFCFLFAPLLLLLSTERFLHRAMAFLIQRLQRILMYLGRYMCPWMPLAIAGAVMVILSIRLPHPPSECLETTVESISSLLGQNSQAAQAKQITRTYAILHLHTTLNCGIQVMTA